MKVLLLFPPHWAPAMPHLALPALTAYLRAHGVQVIQRDLNIEVFDQILTRAFISQSADRLRRAGGFSEPCARRSLSEATTWAIDHGRELAAQVEQAKQTLRSDAFFDGPACLKAFETITACLDVASLPFAPSSLELTRFVPPVPADQSQLLLQAVRDPRQNLFHDLFRSQVQEIEKECPDIIGISICTMDQMLAGMTLGHLIKEAKLPGHVVVGGPHITMLREQLRQTPAIWSCFDSAVVFSGQVPLLRLVEALDRGSDLSGVPNLIYRAQEHIVANPVAPPPPIGELPFPDFDGLPLDRYLSPRLILPLISTHRCYYGRAKTQCAFCNQGYGGSEPFSQIDPERLVEQITMLANKYGTRHLFFADEAMTPHMLRELSARLEALGAPVEWTTCVRFEKALTRELLEGISRGGGRMLLFGLESGAEKIIGRIGKGTKIEEVERILRDSSSAGIWNHLFFVCGFPGETIEDAQKTVDLVYRQQQHIHSASPGTFLLERDAPAHRHSRKYGIRRVAETAEKDLAIYFDYQVESGMDEDMAELVISRLLDVLPEKPFGQYYVHDAYRFLYASYLKWQEKPFPPWIEGG